MSKKNKNRHTQRWISIVFSIIYSIFHIYIGTITGKRVSRFYVHGSSSKADTACRILQKDCPYTHSLKILAMELLCSRRAQCTVYSFRAMRVWLNSAGAVGTLWLPLCPLERRSVPKPLSIFLTLNHFRFLTLNQLSFLNPKQLSFLNPNQLSFLNPKPTFVS